MPITLNFNMRKFTQSSLMIALAIVFTGSVAYAMQPAEQVRSEKSIVASIEAPNKAVEKETEPAPIVATETAPAPSQTVVSEPTPVVAPVQDNETYVWNALIGAGYSRNQTAGIMGNLQQEHGFNTDGDGLAQWLGNRKANLYAKANPNSIETQTAFLLEELDGPYAYVKALIKGTESVEQSMLYFQNQYERCDPNYCMPGKRIQYAQAILAKH